MDPVRVLVKVHADGYVEVLGPPNVFARIVYVPICQNSLQERLLERDIDRSLPQSYHYLPGDRREVGYVRGLGVTYDEYRDQLAQVAQDQELIKCLKSMAVEGSSSTPPPTEKGPCGPSTSGQTPNTSGK